MEIKMIKPTDVDYPLAMNLVPFAEKYDLMKIDNLVVVPLFQVIDAISEVKADIVVHDGVECCPTCMKPIKGTFTKSDMVAMLTEIQLEIEEVKTQNGFDKSWDRAVKECSKVIQQKIDALKGENT
jgi:hypothetical protein